jgi:hypothetical protein
MNEWLTAWMKHLAGLYARRYWYANFCKMHDGPSNEKVFQHVYETGFRKGVELASQDEHFRSTGEDGPLP